MQTRLVGLGLLLSIGALAVAAYAITRADGEPSELALRLDEIDARLDLMEATLREPRQPDEATLVGLAPGVGVEVRGLGRSHPERVGSAATPGTTEGGEVIPSVETKEQILELVDEAVAKKAAQIQQMADKKPSIDAFAKTLTLTDAQREIIEREVVLAQSEIRSILETPTEDGTNLLDELVEVMADGMANPGENPQRGMKWFGRIMTEQIPGTSETYAMRAEQAKSRLRETLKNELSEEQHALYESWQMDPSEIEDVPGSPWKELETRIFDRAKDLGAEIPENR